MTSGYGVGMLCVIAAVFLLAGWVKGIVGMGFPTVVIGVLGLFMPPVQAAALMVVPSLVTNVWQFASGPDRRGTVRRLWRLLAGIALGTVFGIGLLTGTAHWPVVALGAVLAAYGLIALLLPPFVVPRAAEGWLAPLVGLSTGAITGATGVFAIPAVPYISALGLSKDALVQALGLSFTVSTLALAIALAGKGSYPWSLIGLSSVAVLPSLVGMAVGQRTRGRISPTVFRRWFFVSLVVVGGAMVVKGLWR